MDIIFSSSDPKNFLALLDVQRSSGVISFTLSVHSRGFSANLPDALEYDEIDSLLMDLRSMYATLNGYALLQARYEETYVRFEMNKLGGVDVTGQVVIYGDLEHRLIFGFRSDQTCLPPFISGLENVVMMR